MANDRRGKSCQTNVWARDSTKLQGRGWVTVTAEMNLFLLPKFTQNPGNSKTQKELRQNAFFFFFLRQDEANKR